MSQRTRGTTAILRWSDAELERLLERIQGQISTEDYACLQSLVHGWSELVREVRAKGTTIARLRRLFGLRSNETTAAVLGKEDSASEAAQDEGEASGERGEGTRSPSSDARGPRRGHGRIPASDYARAGVTALAHEHLRVGDRCWECGHGTLYRLREPARILRIVGQAPLAARCWECERLRPGVHRSPSPGGPGSQVRRERCEHDGPLALQRGHAAASA
jgi:hypothetical protein